MTLYTLYIHYIHSHCNTAYFSESENFGGNEKVEHLCCFLFFLSFFLMKLAFTSDKGNNCMIKTK